MKKVYNYFFITLLLSIGITSCVEKLDEFSSDMQLNTTLVGPVGTSRITITDLLAKLDVDTTYIKEHPNDKLLYFRYEDTIQIQIEPLKFRFGKFEKVFQGAEDEDLLSLKENYSMSFDEKLELGDKDDSDKRIDSVWVKEGQLKMTIDQNLLNDQSKIQIFLFFPDQIRRIGGGKMNPVKISVGSNIIKLEDCMIDFTQGDLYFTYKFDLSSGISVSLNEQSQVKISAELLSEKITYQKVWGYFRYPGVHEEIGIDLFKDLGLKNGELHILFQDPKLDVSATTNISVPTIFSIDSIHAKNSADGTELYAMFKENGSITPFYKIPLFQHAEDGKTQTAFIEKFDASRVNIDEMLGVFPDALDFKYVFEIGGNNMGVDDSFVWEGAYIDVNVGVELPAWFKKGTYIHLTDTIPDINLGDIAENDFNLDKAVIYFELENGLPFDVDVEFSFLDQDNNMVIITNPKLAENLKKLKVGAASVNPATNVVNQTTKINSKIELDNTMLDEIKQFKHLIVSYKVDVNSNASSVKVTSDNFLQVKMNFYLKGGIKF